MVAQAEADKVITANALAASCEAQELVLREKESVQTAQNEI